MPTKRQATDYQPHKERRLFARLVQLQDRGYSVPASYAEICRLFGMSLAEVRTIEDRGILENWPPLEDE